MSDVDVDLDKCLRDHATKRDNSYERYVSTALGDIARLLLQTNRSGFRLHTLSVFIVPAVRLEQVRIIYDLRGSPIAYMCFAYVSDQTIDEFRIDSTRLLRHDEWNEGTNFFVVDVVAPFGHLVDLIKIVRKTHAKNHKEVYFVGRGDNGQLKKIVISGSSKPKQVSL